MKLCFSLMRDISANAVCNLKNPSDGNGKFNNQSKVSVTFSMQRIPLERHFEFIPAQSVLKSHGHHEGFDEMLSAVERGALQGLIAGTMFGLRVRGLRIKFVELQLVEDENMLLGLFESARDAVLNGIFSGNHFIGEYVHEITIKSQDSTYRIFESLKSLKLLKTEILLSEDLITVRSAEGVNLLSEIEHALQKLKTDFNLKYNKVWMLPLGKRLSEILTKISRNIDDNDSVEFEKWVEELEYRKEIAIIENKSPRLSENSIWIAEQEFQRLRRSINQNLNVEWQ